MGVPGQYPGDPMEIWEREDFCGLWCVWEPSTHLGCMRLDVGIVGDRLRCMGPSVKSGELGGCERLVCVGGASVGPWGPSVAIRNVWRLSSDIWYLGDRFLHI